MKTRPYFYIIFCLGLLFGACRKLPSKSPKDYDFSQDYIAAAISTDNLSLTKNYVLQHGNKEEYIKMALEANSLDVLSLLLKMNFERMNLGESPYFDVRSKEALLLLTKAGYSPNVKNYDGESLAEYYFEKEGVEFFKYFLQLSEELNLSSEGQLPFLAVEAEDERLLSLMLQRKANFTMLDLQGNYPIYYAKSEKVLSFLLQFPYHANLQNEKKENILGEVYLRVKRDGKKDLAQKLIKVGVNPNYSSYQMKK